MDIKRKEQNKIKHFKILARIDGAGNRDSVLACSSDDDAINLCSQVQTIAGAAGGDVGLHLRCQRGWSLSSDKIWCKLVPENDKWTFVLNGTAGKADHQG